MCIVCASGLQAGPRGFVAQGWLDHTADGAPVVGPLGATEVNDYRAIVSSSWNIGSNFQPLYGRGAFISFSFQTSVQNSVLEGGAFSTFNAAFINSFQPLTLTQTEAARTALRLWGEASGITFFEVPSGMGDIRFANFDFSLGGPNPPSGAAAYAYYPGAGLGGDVFVGSTNFTSVQLFLHEIGHSLGLRHSFDGASVLPRALDNWASTVMSYTSGGNPGNVLGTIDIEAIRYIYGGPDQDGTQVASWS
ncbi:matrixin family metalloprotease [Brevundimonas sp.]|uniref:matrixin family metalloprotease n=1 Tax=Brevundimonas sp. TaxID=1871086 RepID=UPI00286C5FD1|nr:matrixin family metalloprotease [Brevundimonas sp.]